MIRGKEHLYYIWMDENILSSILNEFCEVKSANIFRDILEMEQKTLSKDIIGKVIEKESEGIAELKMKYESEQLSRESWSQNVVVRETHK